MKLIFMQYLASLKERGELDALMPDLLSEVGLSVISKPALGTKQHGVDVAAVGALGDGERSVFLISIKPGDLRRKGWDSGEQSLRTSLNQILDVYIGSRIPKRYKHLPVVVVLCIGGDLHEDVRDDVEGYIKNNTGERVAFDVWNGDALAHLLLSGVLRENSLPETWRSDFRKAVAMVDEPEIGFGHFSRFVNSIADSTRATRPKRLTSIRQIYVGLWTLYVWAREAGNLEAAYLCSEYALLLGWSLAKEHLVGTSRAARQLRQSVDRLITLHQAVADDYLDRYVEPRARTMNGVCAAVPSHVSLDVNLRMFDLVGRVGMRGLWQLFVAERLHMGNDEKGKEVLAAAIQRTARLLMDVINNNPILRTPIKDDQAIDIGIACLFLSRVGCYRFISGWIGNIARAVRYAFEVNAEYPTVHREYRELVEHPREEEGYRAMATAGSVLVPTLAVWASLAGDQETLEMLADFASGPFQHSTLQLWYPGSDTEAHLYRGSGDHGLAATNIRIERSCDKMIDRVKSECSASKHFVTLSSIAAGIWPLVVLASRHHRMPVPPQFWPLSE